MNSENAKLIEAARSVCGEFEIGKDFRAGDVGAALLTSKGNIFTGICIDLTCGLGHCAEAGAVSEMIKNRETVISVVVAVTADGIISPCGRCRELMLQVNPANADAVVLLPGDRTARLHELMPEHWLAQTT